MREIKFRIWDTDKKEMSINFEIYTLAGYLAGLHPKLGHEIFMQFTGLLDKDGKEIYEGDILKRLYSSGESSEWIYRQVRRDKFGWNLRDYATYICIVVGNIYENPELI